MNWIDCRLLIRSDLYRYCGQDNLTSFIQIYRIAPGFRYSFWMRITFYLKKQYWLLPIFIIIRLLLSRLQVKYGILIPYNTLIGGGLYIGHFGGIVLNHKVIIGRNCNINHGVTIGETFGGRSPGTPRIGNNVYIGPGAFIVGGIEIGDYVAVGANTVVNKSVPESAVVVSGPFRIVSSRGSGEYITNTLPQVK